MTVGPGEEVHGSEVDWKDHYRDFEHAIQPELEAARISAEETVRQNRAVDYINQTANTLREQPPTPEVVAHEHALDKPTIQASLATGNVDSLWNDIRDAQDMLRFRLDALKAGTLVVHLDARAHSGIQGARHSIEAKVLEQDVAPVFGLSADEQSIPRRDVLTDEAKVLPYPEDSYVDNYDVDTLLGAVTEPWQIVDGKKVTLLIGVPAVITYAMRKDPNEQLYTALKQAGLDLAEHLPAIYGPLVQRIEQQEIFDAELDNLANQMADHLELAGPKATLEVIEGKNYNELTQRLLRMAPSSLASSPDAAQNVYSLFQHRVGEVLAQRAHAEAKRLSAVQDIARTAFRTVNIKASDR